MPALGDVKDGRERPFTPATPYGRRPLPSLKKGSLLAECLMLDTPYSRSDSMIPAGTQTGGTPNVWSGARPRRTRPLVGATERKRRSINRRPAGIGTDAALHEVAAPLEIGRRSKANCPD